MIMGRMQDDLLTVGEAAEKHRDTVRRLDLTVARPRRYDPGSSVARSRVAALVDYSRKSLVAQKPPNAC